MNNLPATSLYTTFTSRFFHTTKQGVKKLRRWLPASWMKQYEAYRWELPLVDRTRVNVYTPGELDQAIDGQRQPVTLITTLRDEASHAREWLSSLLEQERLPDEVVIVDGGSRDDSVQVLKEVSASFPIPIKVIEAPGANISRGRNLAIQNASYEIIACTDFGCRLDPGWLKALIAPFESDPSIQVSAGYYQVLGEGFWARLNTLLFGIDAGSIDPQTFLPSSRSLAVRKSLWEAAGRYPEWLSDAGEDSLFDYHAKGQPGNWAFVPQAKVTWRAPNSLGQLLRKDYRYALGDGETGVHASLYWFKTVELARSLLTLGLLLVVAVVLWVWLGWAAGIGFLVLVSLLQVGLRIRRSLPLKPQLGSTFFFYPWILDLIGWAQVLGFSRGVANHLRVLDRQVQHYQAQLKSILEQHPNRKGVIVYPPTHDWGFMFQRPHQMARALARQGYLYFYCTANERTDAVYGFRAQEPGLYLAHVPLQAFKILEKPVVYLGSAWNRATLNDFHEPVIIYDHYDDLVVSGARMEDHQALVQQAKVVLVTNPYLLERVLPERPDALLVPNGADYDFIQQSRPRDGVMPEDWLSIGQGGRPVIGYSGALAEWVDYALLGSLAGDHAEWDFVLVGTDYDGSLAKSGLLSRPNVFWLGMKPYADLFRYIWRFDVGIIPFLINDITQVTSPIKLFEYMACGKPVVTTALPECKPYPQILIAENENDFAQQIVTALREKRCDPTYLAQIDHLARENSWSSRAALLSHHLSKVASNEPAL